MRRWIENWNWEHMNKLGTFAQNYVTHENKKKDDLTNNTSWAQKGTIGHLFKIVFFFSIFQSHRPEWDIYVTWSRR